MVSHNQRLQCTLRVTETNPSLTNLMLGKSKESNGNSPPLAATSPRRSVKTIRVARTCLSV
jgi:hypothetical protein